MHNGRASASFAEAVSASYSGSKDKTIALSLDPLVSSNLAEVQAQINTAFGALGDQVNVFIIDARTQEPSGRDAIWEILLSEWDQGHAPMGCQKKMVVHAKLFLQHQFQVNKAKSHENQSGNGFSIVVLGYHDLFNFCSHEATFDPRFYQLSPVFRR
ncbi:Glycoside hydrolase/deacetylase beta/alpha-barrel [Penicillium viridicatum]|nr:Glycoside hydrolase/deacetylase beta/alpha-barrel [Penicillium viridicatum]